MFKKSLFVFVILLLLIVNALPNIAFASITGIKLDRSTIVVKPGESYDLRTIKVTAIDDINGDIDVSNEVTWSFKDETQQIAVLDGTVLSIERDADANQNVVLLAKYVDNNTNQIYATELTVYLKEISDTGNGNIVNDLYYRGPLKDIVIAQNLPQIPVEIVNNKIQLYCLNIYSDNSFLESSEQIEWSTSDEDIATVDNNGLVTFTGKKGVVVITARYNNFTDSITFYDMRNVKDIVIKQNLKGIDIVYDNNTTKLDVIEVYDDGSFMEIEPTKVTWSSNNPNVAIVNRTGVVEFKGINGSVVITAKLGGLSDSILFVYNDGTIIPIQDNRTELGKLIIEGYTTILVIDEAKISKDIKDTSKKEIQFDLTDIGQTSVKALEIPVSVLNLIAENNKNIIVKANEIALQFDAKTLTVPKGTIDLINKAGAVKLTIQDKGRQTANSLVPVSSAYDITIKAGDKGIKIDSPVKVTFEIKEAKDIRKVGIYYLNESTGKWEYVGGKIDKNANTITFEAKHLSTYGAFEYDKQFKDVGKDFWGYDVINVLASRHIIKGMTEDTFAPNAKITRAEFAALMIRALGIEEKPC